MSFPFDVSVSFSQAGINEVKDKTIIIHSGLMTFLGPNGAGKTQLLRMLKYSLQNQYPVRYVSAGRLGPLEQFRSDNYGGGGMPNYDGATFGDKHSTANRHRIETIQGDYATLSERVDILIKVQERLRKLFKRDLVIDWNAGMLQVLFSRVDRNDNNNYSSAREASGLLHLVAILSALYDDEIKCLIIDEPEVSLHPQLQSFLLDEIKKVAGFPTEKGKKLVLISTHSTEFVSINSVKELASIVFCNDVHEDPIQINPTDGEFQGKKLQALLTRLGQEHKLALFCRNPLLVEGPSDEIICSALARKLDLNLEAAGSQVLPITGKGQFPVVIKLFRLIGKTPSILADADAFTDNLDVISSFTNQESANSIAVGQGHKNASKFAGDIFNDFCSLVTSNWNDISSQAEGHYYWIKRDVAKDDSIAKRRSAFCWMFGNEDAEIKKINDGDKWLNIKQRLISLLDLLERLGCFILRKGTIEAYYKHSATLTTDEKPNAASYEVNGLMQDSPEDINTTYSDIVRALMYCSNAKEINEAEAIRSLLLTVVSPALAELTQETNESDLMRSSMSLGKKASIFRLTKVQEESDLYLNVELVTEILEVEGFPIKIKKGANPIEVINNALRLK